MCIYQDYPCIITFPFQYSWLVLHCSKVSRKLVTSSVHLYTLNSQVVCICKGPSLSTGETYGVLCKSWWPCHQTTPWMCSSWPFHKPGKTALYDMPQWLPSENLGLCSHRFPIQTSSDPFATPLMGDGKFGEGYLGLKCVGWSGRLVIQYFANRYYLNIWPMFI